MTNHERAKAFAHRYLHPKMTDEQWEGYLTQRRSAEARELISLLERDLDDYRLELTGETSIFGMRVKTIEDTDGFEMVNRAVAAQMMSYDFNDSPDDTDEERDEKVRAWMRRNPGYRGTFEVARAVLGVHWTKDERQRIAQSGTTISLDLG